MHHKTKESAIKKYSGLKTKPDELRTSLKADDNEFTPEEIEELFKEIGQFGHVEPPKELHGGKRSVIKKKYDIYRGQWKPIEKITNPFDGKEIILKWQFERDATPKRTNVILEPEKAQLFNETKRLRTVGAFTDQLYEAGSDDSIIDELPNPFKSIKIN